MTVQNGPRFYMPVPTALDAVGVTIPGAQLGFYLTDSDTLADVWANGALTVPRTNPVVADDAGVFPDIFVDSTITYRVVFTGPDDGINPPQELYTWDPCKYPWPAADVTEFDIPFEYLGGLPPTASATIGMYVANRPQTIPGNFDGTGDGQAKAHGHCLVNPTAEFIAECYLNNVTAIGYMRIATDGTVDFVTNGGAAFDIDTDEFIAWRAPVAPDATIANLVWTISGVNR